MLNVHHSKRMKIEMQYLLEFQTLEILQRLGVSLGTTKKVELLQEAAYETQIQFNLLKQVNPVSEQFADIHVYTYDNCMVTYAFISS